MAVVCLLLLLLCCISACIPHISANNEIADDEFVSPSTAQQDRFRQLAPQSNPMTLSFIEPFCSVTILLILCASKLVPNLNWSACW